MTEYNPFMDEREYFKPVQKKVLTKEQKARNAKGIAMFLKDLKLKVEGSLF